MDLVLGIIIGIVVLMVLVGLHELGHALAARRLGVVVKEFALGFPPRAITKRPRTSFLGQNVRYSLNWLPLGGFVRLKGEYDSSRGPGDYGAAGYWGKTQILFAGVAMNWLIAIIIFTIMAWFGLPKILPDQFVMPGDSRVVTESSAKVVAAQVVPGSPAAQAGLQAGDELVAINGQAVRSPQMVSQVSQQHKGHTITVTWQHNGTRTTKPVQLRAQAADGAYFGIAAGGQAERQVIYATWSAPIVGVATTAQVTGATFAGLGTTLHNAASGFIEQFSGEHATRQAASNKLTQASQSVAGPVAILGMIFPQAGKAGLSAVLLLAALVSVGLASMNVLPIPGLDGGRWFTMTAFTITRQPLTRRREENIQATGMLMLLALIVLITIVDIGKLMH